MSTETERPRQKPLPCSVNPLSHHVTQLRNCLAKATDKVSLAGMDTEKAVNQLKLALEERWMKLYYSWQTRKGITQSQNKQLVKNRLAGNP